LSWLSIALGVLCAAWIVADLSRRPAHMGVMNLVWPLCGLFGSLPLLWFYRRYGHSHEGKDGNDVPFAVSVAKGTLHCGAGCTLGDLLAESLAHVLPGALILFGWHSLFEERIFATWVLDYVFAFAIGIGFQYFAIAPMRGLGPVKGLTAALKADTASLTSWQVGMYGLMAIAHFLVFKLVFDASVTPASPVFWFAMQIAMVAGFATAYPVNWWLIRAGIKEKM
jgi:hypothetical protein